MTVTLFVLVDAPGADLSGAVGARLDAIAPELRGLRQALLHRPVTEPVAHPFTADGPGPSLVLELGFEAPADAEAALRPRGLGRLSDALPATASISHQVFTARRFDVPEPSFGVEPGAAFCTYLVRYAGRAEDSAAWLDFYDANHPPIMRRFPGIRQVVTYRPLGWRSSLDWARAEALQRNKVVFDSPAVLSAALASPVMTEMRADRAAFPAFEGDATHHPMWTRALR